MSITYMYFGIRQLQFEIFLINKVATITHISLANSEEDNLTIILVFSGDVL